MKKGSFWHGALAFPSPAFHFTIRVSADEYGFEKYLTEQERVELQPKLLSAVQSICQSLQGKWVAGSGWETNRIDVSPRVYFTLMPEEQSQVLGSASFNPSQSADIVVFDMLSPPKATYVFLPNYMYIGSYEGSYGQTLIRRIPYTSLVPAGEYREGAYRYSQVGIDAGYIHKFADGQLASNGWAPSVKVVPFTDASGRPFPYLDSIYQANEEFLKNREVVAQNAEEKTRQMAELAVKEALEKEAKRVLEKNTKESQNTISLKGIYIGMPIDEAKTLLAYYLRNARDMLGYFYLDMKENNGCLSAFAMDGVGTRLFFDNSFTGEELAQQIADKYGITMEIDAYGRAWQYRDAKSGVKIQIGADGSIQMEQVKSLLK